MDWLNRFNEAISNIEQNLDGELDMNRVAQLACCSTFHFQRMFSYIADVTLSEYIRRRRMTLAALELQSGSEKIIDIALKYGYDSPTAFNRAFQSVHGVAPSSAKKSGVILKAYPPISFKITIKGEAEMNYRIEKRESFKIIGIKEHCVMGVDEAFEKVPLLWQKAYSEGIIEKLCGLMDDRLKGILGVSSSDLSQSFDYYVAVSSDKETPDNLDELIVPEVTWAIFECVGPMPHSIQNLQKRIVTEWLPNSGYEYANAPDIELYFEGDQSAADYRSEVWLPIVKK